MTGKAQYEDQYWWSNDGLRLHYRDYAGPDNRPPILCIPGLTRNARDFAPVAERLTGDWRLICVDLRGRGESAYAKDPMTYVPFTYMQDMERLIAELALDRFILFGTSLGGIVSMLLTANNPARIAAALINDIGPEIDPAGLARIKTYVGKGSSFQTWMHAARALAESNGTIYPLYKIADWVAMAKRLYRLTSAGRIVFDYDLKIAEPFRVPGGEVGVDLWPLWDAFKTIPTLIVQGAQSDILSDATAKEMKKRAPKSNIALVKGMGHAPVLDEPVVAAAIDMLLAKLAA